jgi:uncharacterized protein YbjT (DUF2867 family)
VASCHPLLLCGGAALGSPLGNSSYRRERIHRAAFAAGNFTDWIAGKCKRVIYLGGLVPEGGLSQHLESRENVNRILRGGEVPITTFRASIIVGSGFASFEIIRDLAEKLPVMMTPKWTWTQCQPVAIRNVIAYLTGCLGCRETIGEEFDIGGGFGSRGSSPICQAWRVSVGRRIGTGAGGVGGGCAVLSR